PPGGFGLLLLLLDVAGQLPRSNADLVEGRLLTQRREEARGHRAALLEVAQHRIVLLGRAAGAVRQTSREACLLGDSHRLLQHPSDAPGIHPAPVLFAHGSLAPSRRLAGGASGVAPGEAATS